MKVKFYGTRGSIATPGPATTKYGGNTSCVEVRCGNDVLIFDAGTGIRQLGLDLMDESRERPITVHIFISHTHWDHIQGFPFFMPAYSPQATIHLYGSTGQGLPLEKVLRGQMDADYFPVALGDLNATLHVHEFKGKPFEIGDTRVHAMYMNHPGMTLGYRIEHGGKTVVYATDNEPYRETLQHLGRRAESGREFGGRLDRELIDFVRAADLYIGEAQYTDDEYPRRVGWGHSSISATVDVAIEAGVRALAFFHHDPLHDDAAVEEMARSAQTIIESRDVKLECFPAREGETIDI